jgi:uncharacterized PurR-regulated membrane protein YhhQ (DUF165 family)
MFYAQATATKLRQVVCSILVVWAIVNALLTNDQMPTIGLRIWGFISSLGLSVLFIALLFLVWDWLVRRFGRATRN